MSEDKKSGYRLKDFYNELNLKLTDYNARLLLRTVTLHAGVDNNEQEVYLDSEQAKSLCLELIKQGGPAFQVGKNIYAKL